MKVQKWWHRPRPMGFLNYGQQTQMSSEYIDAYPKHRIVTTLSCKPSYDLRKSDKRVSKKTTFREDYIPHPLPKQRIVTKELYKPPNTPMDGVSTYKQDYPLFKADRREMLKRKEARSVPTAKFDAIPTYASAYKKWNLAPRAIREVRGYNPPKEKMENVSTFRRDYIMHPSVPRESAKPPNIAFQSDAPLQDKTIHNINFIPHKIEPRPPQEIRKYSPPTVSMDTITTQRQSYMGHKAPPAESAKPAVAHFMSKEPLASSSEFRDRFVVWPVEKPYRHEMEGYRKPPGEIDLQTTQRLDFKHVITRPAESKKPEVRRSRTEPFVGETNYRSDFKKWQVPRESLRLREENLHPSGKFEGESTTRLHFVRHSAPPARSCKPDGRAYLSDAPLDDHTIYRTDYVSKSMDQVERYPTPEWMKEQMHAWNNQHLRNSPAVYEEVTVPRAAHTVGAVA